MCLMTAVLIRVLRPRGAGVVIVFLYAFGLVFFGNDALSEPGFLTLALCPLGLGLVGLLDDVLGLSSTARFVNIFSNHYRRYIFFGGASLFSRCGRYYLLHLLF